MKNVQRTLSKKKEGMAQAASLWSEQQQPKEQTYPCQTGPYSMAKKKNKKNFNGVSLPT
jgi:hypothetical protein